MSHSCRWLLLAVCVLLFGATASPAGDVKPAVDGYGDPVPAGAVARLGTVRLRHGGIVNAVVFSPDGKLVYSGGNDLVIRVWERDTGKQHSQLKGHTTPVTSLHLFADGKTLISTSLDNTVRFWDLATQREVRRWPKQKDNVTCLALSRDDRLLFTGSSTGIIRQWLAATGLEMRQLTGHPDAVKRLVLSPDGKQLISAGMDGSVRVWDVEKGTIIRLVKTGTGPKKGFDRTLALAPDGSVLAIGAPARPIKLWDMATFKDLRWSPDNQSNGSLLAFTPNSQTLAVSECTLPTTIRLFGVTTGKELRKLDIEHSQLQALAFSPNGKFLAGAGDHNVRLWEVAGPRELHATRGHFGSVHSIHFAQDGKTVLSTSNDRTARVWDTATGKELGHFEGHRLAVLGGGVLADGKSFISGGQGGIVQWELADGVAQEIRQLDLPKGISSPTVLVMSPDGKWLATASGSIVGLWSLIPGGELRQRTAAGPVHALVFSPDSHLLVSSSVFTPTQLWDVTSGKPVRQFAAPRGSNSLAFSADGKMLATYDGGLRLLEVATGQERVKLDFPSAPHSLAFSPDGHVLAVSAFNGPIRLWDALSGRELGELAGHQGGIKPLVFSPDGKKLISGGSDSTMLIWDLAASRRKRSLPAVQLQVQDLELLWRLLADSDTGKAYQAIVSLVAAREQALPMLKERLRPQPDVKPEQIKQLIAELDSNAFGSRQKAMKNLEMLEEIAEPALRKALEPASSPTPEMRGRIQELLGKIKTPNPDVLRSLRALEVLEYIDSAEARQLLTVLANGGSGHRLTQAARAALKRSEKWSR